LIIGVINGFSVAILRIRPLLATLATLFIGTGTALLLLPLPGGQLPIEAVIWYQEPSVLLSKGGWFIVCAIVGWIALMATPFGLHLRATGHDVAKAFASGVPVVRTQFLSYVFSSLFVSVGGVALTLYITAGDPAVGGAFTLNAIAAAILGGVALGGGVGEAGGPVFGALFLGLIVNTVLSGGVSPWYQWLVSGVIIVLGLAGTVVLKKSGLLGER
jgi:ribose transport system permease protein